VTERVFTVRTEPHRAVIGDTTLLLVPEASSGDFLDAYNKMRAAQDLFNKKSAGAKASGTKHAKAADLDPEALGKLTQTMREFISRFLMPESAPVFASLKLPDRVLLELIEFAAELYGGGSGNQGADGGTSTG